MIDLLRAVIVMPTDSVAAKVLGVALIGRVSHRVIYLICCQNQTNRQGGYAFFSLYSLLIYFVRFF